MSYGIGEPRIDWTDAAIARLTELFEQGLSASQIAAAMGEGRSRNAIIGKIHRLGFRQPAAPRPPAQTDEERRIKDRDRKRRNRQHQEAAGLKKPIFVRVWNGRDGLAPASIGHAATDLPAQEAANPRGIFDLKPHDCCWPVSGTGIDTLFCAQPAADRQSYCAAHCRMASVTPRPMHTPTH